LEIRSRKFNKKVNIPDVEVPEELKEDYDTGRLNATNSRLYHRKVTSEYLDKLLDRIMYLALVKGCKFSLKFILDRSLKPEPDVIQHKFEGLTGLNNMEKISQAYELTFQALGEGKLDYKQSNDLCKSLTSFSNHLRDTKQIVQITDKIDMLTTAILKICSVSDLQENEELKNVLKDLQNTTY
jgi:hypothetical protein